jgi:phosphatidylglycerol:prolipoprotein diacylglycerol transferase
MIEWNVNPEIFNIGFISIRYYSLAFIITFLLGYYLLKWIFKRENKPAVYIDRLFTYMFIATLAGARLGHCLFYDPGYYLSHPLEIIMTWKGGLASHGAAVGILIALYYFARKAPDLSYQWLIDRLSIMVAFGASMVRLGNLMNSEIYGKPTDVSWAFVFVTDDPLKLPRHPTQIYEAAAYMLLFVVLLLLYKKYGKKIQSGLLSGLFFVGLFGARFVIEFFKEVQEPFESSLVETIGLDMGQLLSIPLVLTGIVLLLKSTGSKKSSVKAS